MKTRKSMSTRPYTEPVIGVFSAQILASACVDRIAERWKDRRNESRLLNQSLTASDDSPKVSRMPREMISSTTFSEFGSDFAEEAAEAAADDADGDDGGFLCRRKTLKLCRSQILSNPLRFSRVLSMNSRVSSV